MNIINTFLNAITPPLYTILEFIALFSACGMVIFCSNPIHSFILFVFCVISIAVILIMVGGTFVGMTLLVVYVGAICVLFLFVIMMLHIKTTNATSLIKKFYIFTLFYLSFIASYSINYFVLYKNFSHIDNIFAISPRLTSISEGSFLIPGSIPHFEINWLDISEALDNIVVIGSVLYTHFFPLFIISGFLLFVAMIGSIFLTITHYTDARRQNLIEQITLEFNYQLDMRSPGSGQTKST